MLLTVNHAAFSYDSSHMILKNITFQLDKKSFVGILGPNGIGKSTLLKCINRIYPLKEGHISLAGNDISKLSLRQVARKISYVPQRMSAPFPTCVLDTVLLGRLPYNKFRFTGKDQEIALKAIENMALQKYMLKDIRFLSGGEQQRVLIAHAPAGTPDLILMDEPTSSLDIKYQIEILHLIRKLVRETELSVLMTIHDLNLAAMFCDRLLILKDGHIWKDGTPSAILTEENIKTIYGIDTCIIEKNGQHFIQLVDPEYTNPMVSIKKKTFLPDKTPLSR